MTELSLPFQDGVGDGGPYSATEWHLILETLGLGVGDNVGVVRGILNELVVTTTGNENITVDTGRALVEGIIYENGASESKTTASPVVGTTGRRAVLRAEYSARTVRIAIISSSDGTASLPALTQVAGVTWEIPLASFTITTGGVIGALTDEREWTQGRTPSGSQYVSRIASNRYSAPGWECDNYGAQAVSGITDRIIFQLIVVPQEMSIDRIAMRLDVNANAGEKARLGIYSAAFAADGYTPDALIIDGGSALAVDAGAVTILEDTIAVTPSAGIYFLALVTDATSGSFTGPVANVYTGTPVIGVGTTAFANQKHILQTDADAGEDWANNGLPAVAPAVTGYLDVEFAMVQVRDTT